jgi:hypothetical protein
LGIRAGLAAVSVIALLAVAGCGGGGPENLVTVSAAAAAMTLPVGNIAPTRATGSGLAKSGRPVAMSVTGSMALVGVWPARWR